MKRPQIDVTTCRNTTINKVNALNYLHNTSRGEESELEKGFAFYVLIIIMMNTTAEEDNLAFFFGGHLIYAASSFSWKCYLVFINLTRQETKLHML